MMPARPAVSTGWREGNYFDLWMVVHFLSGVAGGFFNVFAGLSTLLVFAIGFVMMTVWEIGERAMGIREAQVNRVLDVVVGLAGVGIAIFIAGHLERGGQIIAFWVTLGTASTFSAIGTLAYKRRAKNKKRAATES